MLRLQTMRTTATSFPCRYKINRTTIDPARLRHSEREEHARGAGYCNWIQEDILNEEINSETVENAAARPEDTPESVIARNPQATKQSSTMTSIDKIASLTLAMSEDERPGKTPEKPDDTGKLAELETALSEARQSLAARTGDYDRLKAALDDTVSAYRKLAVSSSPLYSDDMISGSTVEEIDASIKKVNGLVKKMRSTLEAELKDLTIPAGAPERSAPDLSGLSPREKIKYGIQDKK